MHYVTAQSSHRFFIPFIITTIIIITIIIISSSSSIVNIIVIYIDLFLQCQAKVDKQHVMHILPFFYKGDLKETYSVLVNSHQKTQEYIKGKSPFIYDIEKMVWYYNI